MNLVACISEQIDRLVHPAVHASPIELAQHRSFIATRLTLSIGAVALLPFYLASGRIPGGTEALLLVWLILPLVAVAHVAKTGLLLRGEIASAAAWIGLALTLDFGGVCGIGPSFAVLLLMMMQANLSERPRVVRLAMLGTVVATLVMVAGTFAEAAGAIRAGDPVFYVLAAFYGAAISYEGSKCRRVITALETLDARRYRLLSEAIGDAVLRYDRSGSVLRASESTERLFGIKPRDLMGRGFFERVHVADRPAFLKMVSDAANGPDAVSGTVRLRLASTQSADGRYQEPVFAWVEMRTRRLEGDTVTMRNGMDEQAVMAVIRDVTVRMAHEAEIERAKRDAQEASAWKDRFLATVSHELRTPLNAIIGFGEILASAAHAPQEAGKRREYADIIHKSGEHLLAVVNSLLDLSKIDSGKFDLIFEPFDMAALVVSCCDMVGLQADQSRIELVRELDLDGEMVGDKRACKQIVINLLSNALKFTPERGKVVVGLRHDGDRIVLHVADTGIGIRAGDLARLGDPFFQAQQTYDRSYEGTGLGLSVVSGLVGLHGGTIAVESAPGEGTQMTVRLPRDARQQTVRPEKTRIEVIARMPPRRAALAPANDIIKVQKIA